MASSRDCAAAAFSQLDGGFDAFAADAGDENFLRRGGFGGYAQYVAGFGVVQGDGLAGGTEEQQPGKQAARVVGDVGFKLAEIDALVRIERRGNGGKNALDQHGFIVVLGTGWQS